MNEEKEPTAARRDEAALRLDESGIGEEDESPVQLPVFPSDVLHTVLPAQLAHAPADLLSPAQVASHRQKRHLNRETRVNTLAILPGERLALPAGSPAGWPACPAEPGPSPSARAPIGRPACPCTPGSCASPPRPGGGSWRWPPAAAAPPRSCRARRSRCPEALAGERGRRERHRAPCTKEGRERAARERESSPIKMANWFDLGTLAPGGQSCTVSVYRGRPVPAWHRLRERLEPASVPLRSLFFNTA